MKGIVRVHDHVTLAMWQTILLGGDSRVNAAASRWFGLGLCSTVEGVLFGGCVQLLSGCGGVADSGCGAEAEHGGEVKCVGAVGRAGVCRPSPPRGGRLGRGDRPPGRPTRIGGDRQQGGCADRLAGIFAVDQA